MHRKPSKFKRNAAITLFTLVMALMFAIIGGKAANDLSKPNHQYAPPALASFTVPDSRAQTRPHTHLADFSAPQEVIVSNGQTLSGIAAKVLGSARNWPVLWWDNRSHISNPNILVAGTRLRFGKWDYVRPWLRHRANAAIPAPPPVSNPPAQPTAQDSAPAQPTASSATTATVSAGSGFEQCVISRESGGNPSAFNPASGAGGLFQFLPSTWAALGFASSYPGGAQTAPVSVQEQAFQEEFAQAGTSPWAPYDGC